MVAATRGWRLIASTILPVINVCDIEQKDENTDIRNNKCLYIKFLFSDK